MVVDRKVKGMPRTDVIGENKRVVKEIRIVWIPTVMIILVMVLQSIVKAVEDFEEGLSSARKNFPKRL